MWPVKRIQELFGIDHPIVQAPMAGSTTPALVAAVSGAGGLGSHGCAAKTPDDVRGDVARIRQMTDRPFNLNFFVHEAPDENADTSAAEAVIAAIHCELDAGAPSPPRPAFPTFSRDTAEALLELAPAVVSFHFGLPDGEIVRALQENGSKVIASATTVAEARALAAAGLDAIIAQGAEAGGHRGTFLGAFDDGMIGTLALVPQIVDAVDRPVIAAGGIMDGRGIAAALALGAAGVQMGTAFLSSEEANVAPAWRRSLAGERAERTLVTAGFSGRPARAIRNRFVDSMAAAQAPLAPFPMQYGLTAGLRKFAAERDDPEYTAMWAGQAAALGRPRPAARVMADLVAEFAAVRAALGG